MKQIPSITLRDGIEVPAVGFGTYALNGNAGVQAITSAIHHGYRLLDTAYNYENEGTVGEAVRRSAVPREELFITSKLPGRYQQYDKAVTAIQESLYRAGLDYYDLYLIHWPNPQQGNYVEAWKALLDAKKWGLVRSVGVCNFLPEHLDVLEQETGVKPSINQIELHPFFNQADMLGYHFENGIVTQSWSPLAKADEILGNETLKGIAANYNKSISQIVLRWHYQLGSIAIPKSASPQRQLENISIFDFELSDEEMDAITVLSREDGRLNNQDPSVYEEF
ncbi:2,5-diketo-D-gluconic acid reductase [Pontibacillus halophilus JSM 076056 = DSM 19796]|uniref:2,5-diketo-D-gluconic acid reductase n=1 Tax=Pontibacillus halophilus JSM 076056 = DSM 19796 TaxID=1385510 RepID=A0A0A5GQ98_9BACI|nr:aldo/keto reductase [Pontibacillus halophilus]KGX93413.1 2,5-diketo-D-gluconic acid reductase [Pontibacillus halophilus JSM 076056 = DSM 19796]